MSEGDIFIDNEIISTQIYVASWYLEIMKYGGHGNFGADHHIKLILHDFREMVVDIAASFTLFRDLSGQNFMHGINAVKAFQSGNPNKITILQNLKETQVSLFWPNRCLWRMLETKCDILNRQPT